MVAPQYIKCRQCGAKHDCSDDDNDLRLCDYCYDNLKRCIVCDTLCTDDELSDNSEENICIDCADKLPICEWCGAISDPKLEECMCDEPER